LKKESRVMEEEKPLMEKELLRLSEEFGRQETRIKVLQNERDRANGKLMWESSWVVVMWAAVIILVVAAISFGAGYPLYKNYTTPDDITHCYIEYHYRLDIYRIYGSVSWHRDIYHGRTLTMEDAIEAMEGLNCGGESN